MVCLQCLRLRWSIDTYGKVEASVSFLKGISHLKGWRNVGNIFVATLTAKLYKSSVPIHKTSTLKLLTEIHPVTLAISVEPASGFTVCFVSHSIELAK